MSYDFKNLSSADFEDLVRDLIGKEEGLRFEAFCAGPDGGIDGRHAQAAGSIILQAKHYEGSSFSKLNSALKRERVSIDRLSPSRYLLATSCKLTPLNKKRISAVVGSSLKNDADVFGPEDLNGLLRKYPDILRSHIKLWLSGLGVLEQIVNAASRNFAAITIEDIVRKVRVYASNPSFEEALYKLEKHHVLIISGPPGVGKTTLAEMVCYSFLREEWELVSIRSLEDGFAGINDSKAQLFLFDDFLGKVALDKRALAHKDSELARFMKRIKRSPNARFILTTRGYIFEEARRVSEYLGAKFLDVSKYVLDVGVYTRRIKARILYNHLYVSEVPRTHILALIDSNKLSKIIDHKNYNPRVIEAMTDSFHVDDIEPAEYPKAFIEALDNPSQIWDTAFRTHIDHRCQNLLIAMFFHSEHGVSINALRSSFETLHTSFSATYGLSHGPKDFEEALYILEGSFINIVSIKTPMVSFVNPSLKDYLSKYLLDSVILIRLVTVATSVDWLSELWDFAYPSTLGKDETLEIAMACVNMLEMVEERPHFRSKASTGGMMEYNDASNSKRLWMLMDWWDVTGDQRVADSIIRIARLPKQGFNAWYDGSALVAFYSFARKGRRRRKRPFIYDIEFYSLIESALVNIIRHSDSDMLSLLLDAVDTVDALNGLPKSIDIALHDAVLEEFDDYYFRMMSEDSESALSDRIENLRKFALRFEIPQDDLNIAIAAIEKRINEIEDRQSSTQAPNIMPSKIRADEIFDDRSLRDLFTPLLGD